MTPAGVTIYGYQPHSTFCEMPYPAPHKFIDDISYLHRIGVVGYYAQSYWETWGTYGITYYASARAMWNPQIDPDELVADYCNNAFRKASEPMKRFYATIEAALEQADHTTEGIWTYMKPEVMTEARRHLDAAHAAAASDVVKKRLRTIEISFHYGEMGIEAWRKAHQAIAEHDVALLEEAINIAEAAAQYCLDEQDKEPHYAAFSGKPGKLTRVYAARWEKTLKSWQ